MTPLFSAEATCKFFGFCSVEMASFLGGNRCFRGENVVGGVSIVYMVAS